MANTKHLNLVKRGREVWQQWRNDHPDEAPDLTGADLAGADLRAMELRGTRLAGANLGRASLQDADLSGSDLKRASLVRANLARASLRGADLSEANLHMASLRNADLRGARLRSVYLFRADLAEADMRKAQLVGGNLGCSDLSWTDLSHAEMGDADLRETNLSSANLTRASLDGADLSGGNLEWAQLVETTLQDSLLIGAILRHAQLVGAHLGGANLKNCQIDGIQVSDSKLDQAVQEKLLMSSPGAPVLSVDDLALSQLISLLAGSQKLREMLEPTDSPVVLVVGDCPLDRMAPFDVLTAGLRREGFTPVLLGTVPPEDPERMDLIETLARLSQFAIAHFADAEEELRKLERMAPALAAIPVQPVLRESANGAEGRDLTDAFPSFLTPYRYRGLDQLIQVLQKEVIGPAAAKAGERKSS